jgi:hypothetical protein
MVRHSECRDFTCGACGKQFKRKDKLREHLKKVHSGPKPPAAQQPRQREPTIAAASSQPKFVPQVIVSSFCKKK